jgi:WD40 repeat protein
VRIWDPEQPEKAIVFEGHAGTVWSLAALPDGRVASGGQDNTVRIWNPAQPTARPLTFEGDSGSISALAVLADGRVVSASDRSVRVWNTQDPHPTHGSPGKSGGIEALAVLPDGRVVSSSWHDATLWVWEPREPECRPILVKEHGGRVLALAVLPDGRIVSARQDRTIRLWDPLQPASDPVIFNERTFVWKLAVLPDGRVVAGSMDGTVSVWDPKQPAARPIVFEGHTKQIQALTVLPDGRVISGSEDATLRVWNPRQPDAAPILFEGHSDFFQTIAVLPDGRIVSAGYDGTVRVSDPSHSAEQIVLENRSIRELVVLPDSRVVWSNSAVVSLAGRKAGIWIWDPRGPAGPVFLEGSPGWARLAVLPDGRLVSGGTAVQIWSHTFRMEKTFIPDDFVTCLAIDPSGLIVAGCHDGTVHFLR